MSSHARFTTTAWNCVRDAQNGDDVGRTAAVNRLITTCWRPVYRFLRARGQNAQDAEDLTQEFFVAFLAKGWLGRAEPGRGKFRAFLKTLAGRFAVARTHRNPAWRRESKYTSVSALMTDEDRSFEPAGGSPDEAFDRHWRAETLAVVR